MRKSFLFLFAVLNTQLVISKDFNLETSVTDVTLYHTGALVNRVATEDIEPGINKLVIKNVSDKIVLQSIKIKNKEITILNKKMIIKISNEQYKQLVDKKISIGKQINLIEKKIEEEGFIKNVEELKAMTKFYDVKMNTLKKELRIVENEIADADKNKETILNTPNSAILELLVSVEKRMENPLSFQYVCGGIGWSPSYEINVNSSQDKKIEIQYMAKVMSQTGEDWENINIFLSSSFPLESPLKLPAPSSPWVLSPTGSYQSNYSPQNINHQKVERLKGVEYLEIKVPANLKIQKLSQKYSIKSNHTIFTFPIKKAILPANYYHYGFPLADPDVYLVSYISNWDTLGFVDGVATITYKGNNVGKSVIKFSEADEIIKLPIGKDNNVFLKRDEIANQNYFSPKSFGKKEKTTLAYQFEVKNNNSYKVNFLLVDQIPISQTKGAEVEINETSKGELIPETGDISWSFELETGQKEEKQLIYTIETNGQYAFSKRKNIRKKYKTITCPNF